MLRTAGADVYDQWVNHEIPFNDPAVVAAGERFGEIMFTEGYVLGGAAATADLAFGDAPAPMFDDPPGCWLHRQASFITAQPAFEGQEAGVDYDWFPLPPIDQEGTLYAGELTVVGTDADPRSRRTSSSGSSPRTCSARWVACRRRRGSRPTSTSGPTATPTTSSPTPRRC